MVTRSQARAGSTQIRFRIRSWISYAAAAALLAAVAFLFFYRLHLYPRPWFDDGSYMKAAKNFALNGVYADFSSEGDRYTGAVVGVGPTVLVPVAAAFKLWGVSIASARIPIVIYGMLTLVALGALAHSLRNTRTAFVAGALIFLSPYFLEFSRQVMGEVPGLFFMFAGLWLWLRRSHPTWLTLIGTGVLFGLASITKNHFALTLLPMLFITWVLNSLWYRTRGWLYFVVPGIIAGLIYFGWTYYVLFLLGGSARDIAAEMAVMPTRIGTTFFQLRPSHNLAHLVRLLDTGLAVLIVPAFLYGLILSVRRSEQGQRWGILTTGFACGLAMYFFSLGEPRYAFPALGMFIPVLSCLLHDLTNNFRLDWQGLRAALRGQEPTAALLAGVFTIGLVLALGTVAARSRLLEVTRAGDDDLYRMGQYLEAHVPPETLIETWEPELALVTDHTYHFPPYLVMVHFEEGKYGAAVDPTIYDFRDVVDPEYVIVGSFARYWPTKIYSPERLTDYELILSIGNYEVYKRK